MSGAMTFLEALAAIADKDCPPGVWYQAGGLWMRIPHEATDDDIKAAINELHRHIGKTPLQRREGRATWV